MTPSGKLPITYPRHPNSLVGYIHKPSEGEGNPQGGEFTPQFPFGFGLSYTTFANSNLTVNKNSFTPDETATISVSVRNSGPRDAKEVVQLFISDQQASFTPDVKRLRGFEKVFLKGYQTKTITFKVPIKQLAFVNPNNKMQLEEGDFKVQIADQSATFRVTKTVIF